MSDYRKLRETLITVRSRLADMLGHEGGTVAFIDAVLAESAPSPIAEIAAERRRQMEIEGWTVEHDDAHAQGQLAKAAACYAYHGGSGEFWRKTEVQRDGTETRHTTVIDQMWPLTWAWKWWKPKDRRRDLIRAGALIVAEIERLDRVAASKTDGGDHG
ncbi:MAG: hypothetical protein AAFR01_12180 [Pseudomonadota bacterium]